MDNRLVASQAGIGMQKKLTDADRVMEELQELLRQAERTSCISDKLLKIIPDRPNSGCCGEDQPKQQLSPLWGDFSNVINRVKEAIRTVESRLQDAEI